MTQYLAPADAEYLLRAAQRLRALGRADSEFPLIAKAAGIEPSLHVLKAAFQAAMDAKKLTTAIRFLVQFEAYFKDRAEDLMWLEAAIKSIRALVDIERSFSFHIRDAELAKFLEITDDEKVLGVIGPFNQNECLDVLLDACAEMVQRGEKVKLLLVGVDQPLILLDKRNLSFITSKPWLIRVGGVRRDQVGDYYALLDAVMVPCQNSLTRKPLLPVKAVEALAYGKRLIVSDMTPMAEYTQKDDDILKFEVGNKESMIQALQKSLNISGPEVTTQRVKNTFASNKESLPSVLILGSCVSRDAINPMVNKSICLFDYYARSSLASISSEPHVDYGVINNIASPLQKRMVKRDMDKSVLKAIRAKEFDALIIDLIDERFNLVRSNDGVATQSSEYVLGLQGRKPERSISAYSQEKLDMWKKGVAKLAAEIKESLGHDRVIINKVYWTNLIDKTSGRKIVNISDDQVNRANYFLNKMYDILEEVMPGAHKIEYGKDELLADENHKWGVSAFHYGEKYETRFRKELTSILFKLGLSTQKDVGGVAANGAVSRHRPDHSMSLFFNVAPIVSVLKDDVPDPSPSKQNEMRDIKQVDYATASRWFHSQGNLTDTLRALENQQALDVNYDKPKREFKAFLEGLVRLKDGWPLPPRQPNPGLMTRRHHLLYCLHQSVPHTTNGYSTRSHGVAVGLQQAGWKVRAATRPGFPWDSGAKGLNKGCHDINVEGVTYAACAGWDLAKTPLDHYLAEAADQYLREAQTSGAEIIVAASNHITALPALMAARRLGLPFVYEVRGLWEVTQASTQPEWAGSERYQLMRELEKQAVLEADMVITLTDELADELASWGVSRECITVVPNAVNAELFQPMDPDTIIAKELNLKSGVPVIGYAGSAVAYEGLELLIEALATLKKRGQAFIFILVGDGKVIDTVKARAKALGIEGECRFPGRVPFDRVPRYLSCMDILPIPRLSSAVTEMVSALKPLEAMAMGKAVVLSDVSPHLTMAGSNGARARLFKKDSSKALSDALQALIDNPEERERLGQAARAWVEQERTWDHVTGRYADVLQRICRDRISEFTKTSANAKRLEQITLGVIADQFTTDTLASAVKIVPLSPKNWQEELANQPIDAMFVESAWKGNDGQWHRKVGNYSDEEFAPLSKLLTHCRQQGIPSLFWNKEDPVHFDRFRKTAALCDHVFTTDSRRIIPYLATPGALSQTVSSCPFYASPKIHNLLPSTRDWQATVAYGGTYYGKRYPERTEYMDKIMSAAAPLGLTIYDRQHDDPESPYKYPNGLGDYVVGSLNYEEMIQAYKAHPVQINVNSVLDSPTMFSRRVVETVACGSPLISGPALGMNRYMEGVVHIARTESEAAQALENLLHHPAYRWRVALKGARAIMRAHTTQHRLVQMLRTAGMVMRAPELPPITLMTDEITEASAQGILAQTLHPKRLLANYWQPNTQARLEAAGIHCDSPHDQNAEKDNLWLLADSRALEALEPEDLEDLAWPTVYAPQQRLGFSRSSELVDGEWPGVALENHPIDTGLQLVRPITGMPASDIVGWAAQQPALALRKPSLIHEQAPKVAPKKTVVIAGHDLKFFKPFYPYFTKAGFRMLLDFWTGHNQHNEAASERLIRQADTVFCEWTLGNAIWYGKHKREGQKLVGRLHAQEMRSALFEKVPFEAFETVIFVGPHMLRNAQKRNPALKKNGVVIYNGVDIEYIQAVPRKPTNDKVIGLVGMVPQSKRFDLALDILKELRQEDDGYTLRVKGKRPEEYPWMANRPEEMAWYETQYRRLEEDLLLKGAVIFDPHGNDMPEWYAGIDFVLSTSDFESFHFTVADGAAAGCTPIILPWEGADEIYSKEWVYLDAKAAAEGIKAGQGFQANIREFARKRFSIVSISDQMIKFF